MSQEAVKAELQNKTQRLLEGPLKHVRAAALAAALVPLASLVAAPASAQTVAPCASGGTCGIVFTDTNGNGIFDVGETPIQGVTVTLCVHCDGSATDTVLTTTTNLNGVFDFPPDGLPSTVSIYVLIPTGTQPSPVGPDNIGQTNGAGYSFSDTVLLASTANNFGFTATPVAQPGTGTPGYWKNHPEAWPVGPITVGGVSYTAATAIPWLSKTGKDKTVTMFQSLVSAILNVMIGNDNCVGTAIANGNAWLTTYPVGSNVAGGSAAWVVGDPIHITLDAYDNGLLCAPHRQ